VCVCVCEQFAQSHYVAARWPGVEFVNHSSPVRRPSHQFHTTPHIKATVISRNHYMQITRQDLLSVFEQHERWHELQTPLLSQLLPIHTAFAIQLMQPGTILPANFKR